MTIIHGDCLEVMRAMPAESVKCVVTSPPYNLHNTVGGGFNHGTGSYKAGKWAGRKIRNGYDGDGDNMPHEQYVAWQRDCLAEMMRLLRPDGCIFYNHKWRVQAGLLQDRQDIVDGFPVRQIIIWDVGGSANVHDSYFLPAYEVIYMIAKPACRISRKSIVYTNVWRVRPERKNPHPAPFPLEIPLRCIRAVGGPVLDPFLGSGTTAVAAIQEGVEWTGIERSSKYVEMAEDRLARETAKGTLEAFI